MAIICIIISKYFTVSYDFNSFFTTPTKINVNYAGMISKKKKKNEKTIVLPLLLQEVENVSQL